MKLVVFALLSGIVCLMTGCITDDAANSVSGNGAMIVNAGEDEKAPARPPVPPSKVVRDGDSIVVTIYIDAVAEKLKGPRLEGTAMLRTKWHLKDKFPELPEGYTLPRRLLTKKMDYKSGVYVYSTIYKVLDIEKVLKKTPATSSEQL